MSSTYFASFIEIPNNKNPPCCFQPWQYQGLAPVLPSVAVQAIQVQKLPRIRTPNIRQGKKQVSGEVFLYREADNSHNFIQFILN